MNRCTTWFLMWLLLGKILWCEATLGRRRAAGERPHVLHDLRLTCRIDDVWELTDSLGINTASSADCIALHCETWSKAKVNKTIRTAHSGTCAEQSVATEFRYFLYAIATQRLCFSTDISWENSHFDRFVAVTLLFLDHLPANGERL